MILVNLFDFGFDFLMNLSSESKFESACPSLYSCPTLAVWAAAARRCDTATVGEPA